MQQLPIKPNLDKLQELFIFQYHTNKKMDYKEFELKLFDKNLMTLHEVNHVFEKSDSLNFYAKDIGTKKEPCFSRYIFYKTYDNYYFVVRLNDEKSLYNFVGVNEMFRNIFPKSDYTLEIYKKWKTPLKKFVTKVKKGSSNLDVKIF